MQSISESRTPGGRGRRGFSASTAVADHGSAQHIAPLHHMCSYISARF